MLQKNVTEDGFTIVDFGIDFLTMTAPPGRNSVMLTDIGAQLQELERKDGENHERRLQFQGYRGAKVGRCFVGTRHDGCLVRTSGQLSMEYAAQVISSGCASRSSRIDFQVTARGAGDTDDYAKKTAEIVNQARQGKKSGRPARLVLYSGFGGGDTLSIGARTSARYIRIYDKSRQSKGAVEPGHWRWEIEYKHELAQPVFREYAATNGTAGYIKRLVEGELERQGIPIPWLGGLGLEPLEVKAEPTDLGRQLMWLSSQVAPTVRRLAAQGHMSYVLAALGLNPDLTQERE